MEDEKERKIVLVQNLEVMQVITELYINSEFLLLYY